MKTVFVTSFHQFISRNILHTPILDGLLRMPDVRVVIIAPHDKKEYFEKEFGTKGVSIEYVSTSRAANGFWSLFFKRAAQVMVGVRYKEISRGFSQTTFRDLLLTIFFRYPMRVLGRFRAVHTALRFLNSLFVRNEAINALFNTYVPTLVFSTDVQNENDVMVAMEAKRRGIRVVSMIRSWDNVEMYGILRVIPETLLVWGDFVKNAIIRLNRISPGIVKSVGVPHYDRYLKGPTMPREKFLQSLGADPRRKLILFTPVGDMYVKNNDVDAFILSELSRLDANILVRMPPADTVSWGEFNPPSHVFFYRPGVGGRGKGRSEISRADDDHLINSLYASDAVVSGPSTIMLDAALLNAPVLLFGFERDKRNYKESVRSLYDSWHMQAFIGKGGAHLTENLQEFHSTIAEYLNDPKKEEEGRKRAVKYMCFKTDGKACERVVEVLKLALLGTRN